MKVWIKTNLKVLVKYMIRRNLVVCTVGANRKPYTVRHIDRKWYVQFWCFNGKIQPGPSEFVVDDGPINDVVNVLYEYVK